VALTPLGGGVDAFPPQCRSRSATPRLVPCVARHPGAEPSSRASPCGPAGRRHHARSGMVRGYHVRASPSWCGWKWCRCCWGPWRRRGARSWLVTAV